MLSIISASLCSLSPAPPELAQYLTGIFASTPAGAISFPLNSTPAAISGRLSYVCLVKLPAGATMNFTWTINLVPDPSLNHAWLQLLYCHQEWKGQLFVLLRNKQLTASSWYLGEHRLALSPS